MRGQDSERQFLYKVFFHQAGLGVYVKFALDKKPLICDLVSHSMC